MKNRGKMFCSIATLVPALLFAESHPIEDAEKVLVPGTVEIVADFTGTNPPTRVVRDFLTPCDMSKGGEVSFDMFCEDIGQFSKFMVYFGSGAGWYITYFSPEKCGEWEHRRIRVGRKTTSSEGVAAGWDKVDRIRFSLSRAGTSKSIIRLRDIRYSSHAEEDSPEVVAARRVKAHERLLSMPGKAGERRFAWCHTEYGPFNGDWDKGAKELRDCGFTDIIVNLCCGANAAYESAVMEPALSVAKYGDMLEPCKEACRKYGLKLHVWRLCWRVRWTTKEAVDRLESEGLLQRNIRGGVERDWLCPSNPRNREREIAAMMELVGKGVDGIHFDTIRYSSHDTCFCDGCRERFGQVVGRQLPDDWAKIVQNDPELAATWAKFRADNISAVVRVVVERARAKRSDIEISAAIFNTPNDDYRGRAQDWMGWCREGLLDFVCPMDYTGSTAMLRGMLRMQMGYHGKTKFYPGLCISLWPVDGREEQRLAEQIEAVREEGFGGFTLFQYESKTLPLFKILREGPLAPIGN